MEPTNALPEMTQMTDEQKAQADDMMHQAKLKAIIALKGFASLLLSLPDDFGLDKEALDAELKPRTEELMVKFMEAGLCLQDMTGGYDLIGSIIAMTLGRCKNHTKNLLAELNYLTYGIYEPETEMPVNTIMTRVKALQLHSKVDVPPKS